MDFVKAHAWLAILTILMCLRGCIAPPGDCSYIASTLVWPLGETIGTTELRNQVAETAINTGVAVAPATLDYPALHFPGPASSASLTVADPLFPTAFPEDYAFQFMVYPEADGVVLRYQTDTPATDVDISTVILSLTGGTLYMTLQSLANSDTQPVGHVFTYNTQWYWVSVGRDGSRNVVFVRVDGTEYQLDFAAWTDGGVTTMTPGHFTVGAGFTGRLTCLQVILNCRSPVQGVDYSNECVRLSWPGVIPIPGLVPAVQPVNTMQQCAVP